MEVTIANSVLVAEAMTAYARVGGAAGVDRLVAGFCRMVRDDRDLRRYFPAEPEVLWWHQAAQVSLALGGPDMYRASGVVDMYLPLVVPSEFYHRLAFYMVRAADHDGAARKVATAVAAALGAGRCRIVGGCPVVVAPALVLPVLVSTEAAW